MVVQASKPVNRSTGPPFRVGSLATELLDNCGASDALATRSSFTSGDPRIARCCDRSDGRLGPARVGPRADDALRRPFECGLFRHRIRNARATVLHDSSRCQQGVSRANRAGRGGNVLRNPSTFPTSGTSGAPIVFTAAPGATVTIPSQASGFVISGRSWITVNGFTVTNTSDYGINVSELVVRHDLQQPRELLGSAGERKTARRDQAQQHDRLAGRRQHVRPQQLRGDHGDHRHRRATRCGGTTPSTTRRGSQRAAPGIRVYQAAGNTVDGNITHDNEDSGIESYPGANNTLIYNNVSYNNGDHGIDDCDRPAQRIIGNTVYNNVTAGINLEGNSTGGDGREQHQRRQRDQEPAHAQRHPGRARLDRGHDDGLQPGLPDDAGHAADLELGQLHARSPLSRPRRGQMLHGINADPKWRERRRRATST